MIKIGMCDRVHSRYDYILIWGHGRKYRSQIIKEIAEQKQFEIIMIHSQEFPQIKKLVSSIYSYDYAPIEHLRDKTKYLIDTPKEVDFIFFKNYCPDEDFFGEGSYRHKESKNLKFFKEMIRDKYNPKNNGIRTENHVIHASDNQKQVDYVLKFLGFSEGIMMFESRQTIINTPYYIDASKGFVLKKINIKDVICNVVVGTRHNFSIKTVNIEESPQYRAIIEGFEVVFFNSKVQNCFS